MKAAFLALVVLAAALAPVASAGGPLLDECPWQPPWTDDPWQWLICGAWDRVADWLPLP